MLRAWTGYSTRGVAAEAASTLTGSEIRCERCLLCLICIVCIMHERTVSCGARHVTRKGSKQQARLRSKTNVPGFMDWQVVSAKILDLEGLKRFECKMVLEGGSIHTDGEG